MKYRDLAVVENMRREEMTTVAGGVSFGEFQSARVPGIGFANLPIVKTNEDLNLVTNLGQLLQKRTLQYGLPGINGGIAYLNTLPGVDIKLPRGLQ